jgi:hypothetical protein
MPEFYVEGHTAEGEPYGPVHILTTPIVERDIFEELMEGFDAMREERAQAQVYWEAFEPLSEQAQAWRGGGASAGEWLEFLSAQRG